MSDRAAKLVFFAITLTCIAGLVGLSLFVFQRSSQPKPIPVVIDDAQPAKPSHPGAYRVKCLGCGQEFWSTQPGDVAQCPDCREVELCEVGIGLVFAVTQAYELARANPSNESYRKRAARTEAEYVDHMKQCRTCYEPEIEGPR